MARADVVRAVAGHELRVTLRGRTIHAFALLFCLLALGVALAGLGGSGRLLVQGFTRTAVSLLGPGLYVLPLLGLLLGAAAFAGDEGGRELLLAQPVGRGAILLGRTLGLAGALLVVPLVGFGAAGVLVGAVAGPAGLGGFLLVAAGCALVGTAGIGLGALVGLLARRRTTAIGWALAVWFAAAVLYDLVAIAVLQLVGSGQPGPWLVALLALNPIDGVRAVATVALGADVLLGPTGAALARLLGPEGGALWVTAALVAWCLLPPMAAARLLRRLDL